MHELGIAKEMLLVALDRAAQQHATQIARFDIEMSAGADESEESLRFYFENLTRGTIAQGAEISIRRVVTQKECANCGNVFETESRYTECPACHSMSVRAMQNDFRLASIGIESEVEKANVSGIAGKNN